MNTPLFNSLKKFNHHIKYKLHMPGHKSSRKLFKNTDFEESILDIDLTEIEGVDSLFHPTGSLKEAQEMVAELYGATESIFLVNGASVGILAAIMAIVGDGDELIIPRNAHRSIHNALLLTGGKPVYLMPEIDINTGIAMGIKPEDVENTLMKHPKAKGVLIAHPNFYGLCSDLEEITKITHKYNKILIVDEACGAHFKFHPELPSSGVSVGADIIVHGTHKNLPAMTQSGILHINSHRIDRNRLKECLMILQSSSPSYVLLSSLEIAMGLIKGEGDKLFQQLYENIKCLIGELETLEGIRILNKQDTKHSIVANDFSKVMINFSQLNLSGYEVDAILNNQYGIQCELSDPKNLLLTFTIADSREVFEGVLSALREIITEAEVVEEEPVLKEVLGYLPEVVFTPKEVWNKSGTQVKLEESLGQISLESFSPFPPSVPIIKAGERIDEKVLALLKAFDAPTTIKVMVED